MRNILQVARDMRNVVPMGCELHHALAEFIHTVENDEAFRAPEGMHGYWDVLGNIVNTHIRRPLVEDWEFSFISIFTQKARTDLEDER